MATSTATVPEHPASIVDAGDRSKPNPQSNLPLLDQLRACWQVKANRPAMIGALLCLGMLGVIFWSNLRHFVYVWSTDENYSHGFLVPLISLYFANEAARRGPVAYRSGVRLGVALLSVSIFGRLATILVPVGIVGDLSFVVGLAGVLTLVSGVEALRRFGFPLVFLTFMVPLPIHLYTTIASPLQLLVSQIASTILNASGIPVLCEGNHMTLPGDVKMFVAEACSGMRQLTGFLALTTAVAYLVPRPAWYRVILIASSIPIALTANVARVTLTGWIMYYDPKYAQGAFHTLEGLLMMGFGLGLLWLQCWFLNELVEARPSAASKPTAAPA